MSNGLRIGSLFSGVGGLDLAVESFFSGETVWHCEFDPEPSKVLAARWPGVPNFGDVTAVKWTPDCPACGQPTALYFRDEAEEGRAYYCPSDGWFSLSIRLDDPDADRIPEPVDILCGGFPCQDVSLAGRRAGLVDGTRSGLWSHFRLAISILRPKVVVIENVRGLISAWGEPPHAEYLEAAAEVEHWDRVLAVIDRRIAEHGRNRPYVARKKQERHSCARQRKSALARREREDRLIERALPRVLRELSALGFDAEWHGLLASDIGAPHGRFRVFVLAYARGIRLDERWRAVAGEAQRGRSSAVAGGRADSPLRDRHLLRTPVADELGGGPLHPDVAKERGQTLRLSGQVLALGGHLHAPLLPTPVAQPSGNTPEEHLRKKPGRTVVTDLAILVENDLLKTGGRLLPTPTASEGAKGGPGQRHGSGDATLSGIVPRLLPTPQVADMQGGHASRSGNRSDEMLLPGVVVEGDRQGNVVGELAWGEYEPAVRLWELITRSAPAPTLPDGKNGNHRLAAVFPEWMMGYRLGWVTDILTRNPAIKACGNGVVPQQAYAALGVMWARAFERMGVAA